MRCLRREIYFRVRERKSNIEEADTNFNSHTLADFTQTKPQCQAPKRIHFMGLSDLPQYESLFLTVIDVSLQILDIVSSE